MLRLYRRIGILFLIASLVTGCHCATTSKEEKKLKWNILRVGVTPNYPPFVFKSEGRYTGGEVDFARRLAKALKLKVDFIELRWEELIPALYAGKIDIIMSGMSVTEARKIRINFTDPYLQTGLIAAMRAEDAMRYNSKESILDTSGGVGVMQDTTGDAFVKRNFPDAKRLAFSKMSDAVFALKQKKIDLFIHDAPSIAWSVSENEASFLGFWECLNEEHLAWGVRYDDEWLREMVNQTLKRWKKDGTLDRVLNQWFPYLKHLK